MKKFLKRLIFFLSFCFLFYLFSISIWGEIIPEVVRNKGNFFYPLGDYGFLHTKLQDVKSKKDIDIVVLGSSHAYRGLDTRIFNSFGYNIFNLGSSSQSPIQMNYLVSHYFKDLKPKIVLIEVYPRTFQSDGVESALDFVANDILSFDLMKMVFNENKLKVYNALIYKIYRSAFNLDAGFVEPLTIGEETYIPGGYVERVIQRYKVRKFDKLTYDLKRKQKRAFNSVISDLINKDIEIILFQAPITKDLFNSYTNNTEVDRYFDSFDMHFINFNHFQELKNDSLFYDHHHLNQNGVEVFNQLFISEYKTILDNKLKQ